MRNSKKDNGKFQFAEKLMDFKERDFRLLFWFLSLVTIPVFAYVYALPFTLLAGLISSFLDLNDESISILTTIEIILCFVLALGTQFYLWNLYKKWELKGN